MNKRRFRNAVFLAGFLGLLLVGGYGLWLFQSQRHQYSLNRQLIAALMKNDGQQAIALVEVGADPNTPYHPPPEPSLKQLVDYIFHRSPLSVNDTPTAFFIACGAYGRDKDPNVSPYPSDNPQLVQAMLLHGAKVNARGPEQTTAIFWAVVVHHPKTVEFLLDHGADPNLKDIHGDTPLGREVDESAPLAAIRLLLAHGADPNVYGGDGGTVLEVSQMKEQKALAALLLRYGAKK